MRKSSSKKEKSCVRKMELKGMRKGEHIRKSRCADKTAGPCGRVRAQRVECAGRITRA